MSHGILDFPTRMCDTLMNTNTPDPPKTQRHGQRADKATSRLDCSLKATVGLGGRKRSEEHVVPRTRVHNLTDTTARWMWTTDFSARRGVHSIRPPEPINLW